jgi:hypothetical protein
MPRLEWERREDERNSRITFHARVKISNNEVDDARMHAIVDENLFFNCWRKVSSFCQVSKKKKNSFKIFLMNFPIKISKIFKI